MRILILTFLLFCNSLYAKNEAIELAAKAGIAWAQYELGTHYEFGMDGYPEDKTRAAELYTSAAWGGNSKAQLAIGIFYWRGEGVNQSNKEAVTWMKKSASQSHGLAMYNLAEFYRKNGDKIVSYAWALMGIKYSSDKKYRDWCLNFRLELDSQLTVQQRLDAERYTNILVSELNL